VATVFALRPPELVRADTVLPDERGGARAGTAHLIARGHRKIGLLLAEAGSYRSRQLRAGYAEAMTAAGISADPAWTSLHPGTLADAPVTAVLCADQALTRAALRALGDAQCQVAVVGFGDFELADLLSPPVSVLSYDPVLIGRTAGELLIRRLAGQEAPPRRIDVPVRLVERR
jgi:LacI family transcriptional regulator